MMKLLFLCLCFPCFLSAQIKPDKVKHFVAGTAISFTGSFVSYKLGASKTNSVLIGFGLGLTAGILKEVYDWKTGKGAVDKKDVIWTAVGSGLGSVSFVFVMK